jgi:hypothetical protein
MIRNISSDRETLSQLAQFVVPLLELSNPFVARNVFVKEIFHSVTHTLFHLCRLNRQRQESAAKSGLVLFLKFVIENNKPLKEFAVPMMCELAKTSATTRAILLEDDGMEFFLELLREDGGTFHNDAMDAVAVW